MTLPPAGPVLHRSLVPRWRGAMVSPDLTEDRHQKCWAGLERQCRPLAYDGVVADWANTGYGCVDAWLADQLRKLDAGTPVVQKYGLKGHTRPWCPWWFWRSPASICSPTPVVSRSTWMSGSNSPKSIRDEPVIWGYDLLNEPNEASCRRTCQTGRDCRSDSRESSGLSIHRKRLSSNRSMGVGSLSGFQPLEVPRVVYSVHMYLPVAFTHNWSSARHGLRRSTPATLTAYTGQSSTRGGAETVVDFSAALWRPISSESSVRPAGRPNGTPVAI